MSLKEIEMKVYIVAPLSVNVSVEVFQTRAAAESCLRRWVGRDIFRDEDGVCGYNDAKGQYVGFVMEKEVLA
jgi:hypothetical protein